MEASNDRFSDQAQGVKIFFEWKEVKKLLMRDHDALLEFFGVLRKCETWRADRKKIRSKELLKRYGQELH